MHSVTTTETHSVSVTETTYGKSRDPVMSDPVAEPDTPTSGYGERKELRWGLYLDMGYIKSAHGILTAAIMIFSLIGYICVSVGRGVHHCNYTNYAAYNFYGFTSMSTFLTAVFNYVLYIFTFYDKIIFKFVPWAMWDLLWCGFFTVCFFISAMIAAVCHCNSPGIAAGAVFAFVALILLGSKTYLAYKRVREERTEYIANRAKGMQDERQTATVLVL